MEERNELGSGHYLWVGGGGLVVIVGGGKKIQCKQIEGGKISVQAFRGWQNFSAQTFEGHPEATKVYLNIFSIFQYSYFSINFSYFMPTLHF